MFWRTVDIYWCVSVNVCLVCVCVWWWGGFKRMEGLGWAHTTHTWKHKHTHKLTHQSIYFIYVYQGGRDREKQTVEGGGVEG